MNISWKLFKEWNACKATSESFLGLGIQNNKQSLGLNEIISCSLVLK